MTTMPPLTGNAGKSGSRWRRYQRWRKRQILAEE